MAAQKFNDMENNYKTLALADLHHELRASMNLLGVYAPVSTADKIKEKVAHVRCELMEKVDRWERSGNGEGQRVQNCPDFGHIQENQRWLAPGSKATDDRPIFLDGDNRKNFLNGKGYHLLYMWHLWDQNDIFNRVMSIIPANCSASSDGVAVTLPATRRNRTDVEDDTSRNINVGRIAQSMSILARSSIDSRCQAL